MQMTNARTMQQTAGQPRTPEPPPRITAAAMSQHDTTAASDSAARTHAKVSAAMSRWRESGPVRRPGTDTDSQGGIQARACLGVCEQERTACGGALTCGGRGSCSADERSISWRPLLWLMMMLRAGTLFSCGISIGIFTGRGRRLGRGRLFISQQNSVSKHGRPPLVGFTDAHLTHRTPPPLWFSDGTEDFADPALAGWNPAPSETDGDPWTGWKRRLAPGVGLSCVFKWRCFTHNARPRTIFPLPVAQLNSTAEDVWSGRSYVTAPSTPSTAPRASTSTVCVGRGSCAPRLRAHWAPSLS